MLYKEIKSTTLTRRFAPTSPASGRGDRRLRSTGVIMRRLLTALLLTATIACAHAAEPRARDLGIPFDGKPGPLNAITDVQGVTVARSP